MRETWKESMQNQRPPDTPPDTPPYRSPHRSSHRPPHRLPHRPPHIIFTLLDDVGWNDINYNTVNSPLVTPVMNNLAKSGIQLKQHYMHSLCTPSRAALMTGRYHVNTEITFVIPPPSPAGLPVDITTLPELLRDRANYSTAIVGKWHLGHSQFKKTPTYRGFDEFRGLYSFVPDHFSKEVHQQPWSDPAFIDWVHQTKDGKVQYVAEMRHSTTAVAADAEDIIKRHSFGPNKDKPLFLYVAFPAAHAPLTPIPGHEVHCQHIPQEWRRNFCGLVYGLDEAVGNITRAAVKGLGDNVLFILASDNGGSPWFGGNNMPLKGSKITPFEGGTRVPAFVVDFSQDQHILKHPEQTDHGRVMTDLMHVSDWLPTLATIAGISSDNLPEKLDGIDQSAALRQARPITSEEAGNVTVLLPKVTFGVRQEMLIEMYYPGEVLFNDTLVAYRINEMKYIRGIVRDENFYFEPTTWWMSLSRPTWFTRVIELISHAMEYVYGAAPTDMFRVGLTHVTLQDSYTTPQRMPTSITMRLYNLSSDPYEELNLLDPSISPQSPNHWKDLVSLFEERLEFFRANRPPAQLCHLVVIRDAWQGALAPRDDCCQTNPQMQHCDQFCQFLTPWIPDSVEDVFQYHGEDVVFRKDHDRLMQVRSWHRYFNHSLGISIDKSSVEQMVRLCPWVMGFVGLTVVQFVWEMMFSSHLEKLTRSKSKAD